MKTHISNFLYNFELYTTEDSSFLFQILRKFSQKPKLIYFHTAVYFRSIFFTILPKNIINFLQTN